MFGEIAGYGMVWYHKDEIASILSFAKVSREQEEKFGCVKIGNRFEEKQKECSGNMMMFNQSSNGL